MKTFREVDLDAVLRNNDLWFRGELGRPLFHILVRRVPWSRHFIPGSHPRGTPARVILRDECAHLESVDYMGDAFPMLRMNFGPGVLAEMLGGEAFAEPETVWFGPGRWGGIAPEDFSLCFNSRSDWGLWLTELYEGALALQQETPFFLAMSDLGGVLDVLASLRGTEALLTDLFDRPECVKRLLREETAAWLEAYNYFDAILRRGRWSASSCWASILSSGRSYMLQSDFSYMISPGMFHEFVRPELETVCAKLDHGFYHLDGKGQLGHIPSIASVPGMKGIQWIPGDGQPPQSAWPEVFEQLESLDMKVQLVGNMDSIEAVLRRLKKPENAHVWCSVRPDEFPRAARLIRDFGGA